MTRIKPGLVYFLLALLFSLAVLKGIASDAFRAVLIVPALTAVVLILIGFRKAKHT